MCKAATTLIVLLALASAAQAQAYDPTGLGQFEKDGTTAIAQGGFVALSTTVVMKGTVSGANGGASYQLQVEVRLNSVSFTPAVTNSGNLVSNGSVSTVTVTGLTPGQIYHWQGRTNATWGWISNWVQFGPSDPDFQLANGNPYSPASLDQMTPCTCTSIPVGGSAAQTSMGFMARIQDPDSDRAHLEVEVQLLGTSFTGSPTATGSDVSSGENATAVVTGLALGNYHWQARTVDVNGAVSAWVSFGGNAESAIDFTIPSVVNTPPNTPTSVGQFQSDASTSISVGGTTSETVVVINATLSDPDGTSVRLVVELRDINTGFTAITHRSDYVANNGTAVLTITGLVTGSSYHWQYAAEDGNGALSAWTSFGGNSDSPLPAAADVICDTTGDVAPSVPTGPGQFTSADVVIAVGGSTSDTSIRFKATVSDPNGQMVRFEIEVRPLGTSFKDVSTAQSTFGTSGALATILVAMLSGDYHWQCRTVDANGNASAWISFGGNLESVSDFLAAFVASGGGGGGGGGGGACGSIGLDLLVLPAFLWLLRRRRRH